MFGEATGIWEGTSEILVLFQTHNILVYAWPCMQVPVQQANTPRPWGFVLLTSMEALRFISLCFLS